MRLTGKDWVALSTLGAAALLGGGIALRTVLGLGATWSDGEQRYDLGSERIRYAVWDAPETLELPADARHLALSPDGRWAVFSIGETGLNVDLFLAEVRDGGCGEPEPLAGANSAFDELTPAFDPDTGELYFATDRAGAGLDLWRARFADGAAETPAPVPGVNTPADELDPRPLPGSPAFLFASNRPREGRVDFDLYQASPEGETWKVEPLPALDTSAAEREPGVSRDGRALVFASDRGAASAFDLYRSFSKDGAWLPPEPIHELNSPAAERAPLFADDAFSLVFEAEGAAGSHAFERARSREVFRVPASPPGLTELILIALLVLVGLLAWLSKRWDALDILYKCVLVSLLVHLLALLYLRRVHPEPGERGSGGGERTYRVRLEPSTRPPSTRERGGALELEARRVEAGTSAPERLEAELVLASAAPASALAALATPERALEAPSRGALDASPAAAPADVPALEERERPAVLLGASAPTLALAAPAPSATRQAPPSAAPQAAPRSEPLGRERAAPATAVAAPELEARALAAGAPGPRSALETPRAVEAGASPALASPAAEAAPAATAAPALEVASLRGERAVPRTVSAGDGTAPRTTFAERAPAAAAPAAGDAGQLERRLAAAAGDPGASLERGRVEPTGCADAPAAEVRAPAEPSAGQASAAASAAFDPLAGLASGEATRREGSATAPARAAPAAPASDGAALAPTPLRGASVVAELAEEAPAVPERTRVEGPSGAAPQESGASVGLRAPAEPAPAASGAGVPSPAFDAIAGLAPGAAGAERGPAAPAAPGRLESAPRAAPAPAGAPLSFRAPVPPGPESDDRPRIEQTPYRNRFGQEKLRALEEFGGSVETERAVANGLAYLARIQDAGGFWGEIRDRHPKYGDVRIGKTGLALLAFLGAGHTGASGTEHSAVVERAIRFLLQQQDRAGGHFGESSAYDHGIATYALAECYAITHEERLRAPLERAVTQILRCQSREDDPRLAGGWGYYHRDGHLLEDDPWPRVSVSAWQVMALESASLGGLAIPGEAFDGARAFLLGAWDPRRGAFRYDHDPSRLRSGYPILPASTPAAIFALSLLGADVASPEYEVARRFVLERAPDGYRYTGDDDFVYRARGNLYFWYYGTLAMFRAGGGAWERWNAAMKETLLPSQEEDGSWRPLDVYAQYAGDDEHERAYASAMCVLTLEIYYRYFTPLLAVR